MSEMAVLSLQHQFTSRLSLYTRPSACMRTNASFTALESMSSIVNRSRDQSRDDPRRLSWLKILPPYASFHSKTRSKNFSRPSSCRVIPSSLASFFSTTVCVAIPAWSVPGTHSASYPDIRRHRTIVSWMLFVSAWPMCKAPVTFGGGITTTNLGLLDPIVGLKYPSLSHHSYHPASTPAGLYAFAIGTTAGSLYSPFGTASAAASAAASSSDAPSPPPRFFFLFLSSPPPPPAAASFAFFAASISASLAFFASSLAFFAACSAALAAFFSAALAAFSGSIAAAAAAAVAAVDERKRRRIRKRRRSAVGPLRRGIRRRRGSRRSRRY
mmetsp:Transcript_5126/g.18346  ORF Transcript_5126/g.18346 Transcript_5126/m.18346 type:complete len:327 (+) Transcript_5126:2424-3404(+)